MTTTLIMPTTALMFADEATSSPDESQLAAAAFLARYSGRTLEAYRQDLRYFFQWATDQRLMVLAATRAHIEIYRSTMEQRGLAASTIDRRLSTVCGYYRFAHIDGRISSNPAQYVRWPRVQPAEQHAMDRGELGRFLFSAEHYDRAHAALAVLLGLNGLRVSEACATNIEDLAFERGHRTLRIIGKGNKPAVIPLVPRTARTIDLAIGERHEGPILRRRDGQRLDRRTAHRWVRSIGKRAGLISLPEEANVLPRIMFICRSSCSSCVDDTSETTGVHDDERRATTRGGVLPWPVGGSARNCPCSRRAAQRVRSRPGCGHASLTAQDGRRNSGALTGLLPRRDRADNA